MGTHRPYTYHAMSAFHAPRRSSSSSSRSAPRSHDDQEKQGLLEHLIPPPSHPRASYRTLALGTICVFLLFAVWQGLTDTRQLSDGASATPGDVLVDATHVGQLSKGQGWVYGSGNRQTTATPPSDDEGEQIDGIEEDEGEEDARIDTSSIDRYSKYIWHKDLEWDAEGSGRLIVIGDVHGMVHVLKDLLAELDYSQTVSARHNDTLVFVGDLGAKAGVEASVKTIDYIRSLDAWAVRGNHDQDVINWRNWMALQQTTNNLSPAALDGMAVSPEGAPEILRHKWRDEHFQIAKALSEESFAWLAGRSLTLHIRSLHAYVVHAGLLPWTIPKNIGKKKGKGVAVSLSEGSEDGAEYGFSEAATTNTLNITDTTSLLESASASTFAPISAPLQAGEATINQVDPEISILTVPHNRDPYTLLEMRSVFKSGKVTKNAKKGWPWAPIWNQVMAGCQVTMAGADSEDDEDDDAATTVDASRVKPKQCRPLNVIYGHAASRGLDIQKYSFGLDSGAVYGRALSALVIEGAQAHQQQRQSRKHRKSKLDVNPVVINGIQANVYSLKCKKP